MRQKLLFLPPLWETFDCVLWTFYDRDISKRVQCVQLKPLCLKYNRFIITKYSQNSSPSLYRYLLPILHQSAGTAHSLTGGWLFFADALRSYLESRSNTSSEYCCKPFREIYTRHQPWSTTISSGNSGFDSCGTLLPLFPRSSMVAKHPYPGDIPVCLGSPLESLLAQVDTFCI